MSSFPLLALATWHWALIAGLVVLIIILLVVRKKQAG